MTIRSMTGFAHVSGEAAGKQIQLDIRSVNHRFLDVQFKMPDELRHLESALREQVAAAALRGKVECRINLQNAEAEAGRLALNDKLVDELAELNRRLRGEYKHIGKLTVADILRFPGVLQSGGSDARLLADGIQALFAEALEEFSAARAREGEKLQAHILERLDAMTEIISALQELFPHLLQAYLDKSRARLAEAVGSQIDEDRLKQEFALYMQKADVDEEFSRLQGHIAEVRRIVETQKGSVGKRLDFLMQELNREANTLGSKAIAAECTQASVELKVLIEQMREQVQNIE